MPKYYRMLEFSKNSKHIVQKLIKFEIIIILLVYHISYS